MHKLLIIGTFIGSFLLLLFPPKLDKVVSPLSDDDNLAEILVSLGDDPLPHQVNFSVDGVSIERGKTLFLSGIADKPGGGKTTKQSRHFVCTSCHNIQREDPDLSVSDPQKRLEYVKENGLPFLQGTALYGAVNRTSFYNGYYEKKYGDLVAPARNDIREAIQLCAIECSQGRPFEKWELESVLAYLWTIGLNIGDLQLTDAEKTSIDQARTGQGDQQKAIKILKSKYLQGSPATFIAPPEDRKKGYEGFQGDPENGKLVYELSCLHCHEGSRYAFFDLDDSKASFKYLKKHMDRYTRYSLYQVARYGTSPLNGKRTYMPNYTSEKLSNEQLEDLRAYIEQRAE